MCQSPESKETKKTLSFLALLALSAASWGCAGQSAEEERLRCQDCAGQEAVVEGERPAARLVVAFAGRLEREALDMAKANATLETELSSLASSAGNSDRLALPALSIWSQHLPKLRHERLLAQLYLAGESEVQRYFIDKSGQMTARAEALLSAISDLDPHALAEDSFQGTVLRGLYARLQRMLKAEKGWRLELQPEERQFLLQSIEGGALASLSLSSMSEEEALERLWEAAFSEGGRFPLERVPAFVEVVRERQAQIEQLSWGLEWAFADAYFQYAEFFKLGNLEKFSPEELERYAREDNPRQIHPRHYDAIVSARLLAEFKRFLPASEQLPMAQEALAGLLPQHPQYARLQAVRKRYREIIAAGAWAQLRPDNLYHNGRAPLVVQLKKRLEAEGYVVGNDSDLFDESLMLAIKAYQRHHQLEETGKPDEVFWRSLNISAEQRLAEIEANIRRWHKTLYEARERYIYINVPSFTVELWDKGELIAEHATVVGSSARFCNAQTRTWESINATALMHARMTYLVFNPYWNVPPRIEVDEYQKRMAEDPKWLEKSDFEYFEPRSGGRVLRQKPGPNNALGRVKLIFPNQHNIYLHDTPKQEVFGYPVRAFSHGCIRVKGAFEFAQKVLELDGQWDEKRVKRFFVERGEHPVELKTPIDVFIEYHTVSVDDEGLPYFLADVYRIIRNEIDPSARLASRCDPAVDRTSAFRSGLTIDSGP